MTQYIYEEKPELNIVIRTDENGNVACIPTDPSNSDYQAYLDRDNPKAALSTPIVSSDG